MRDTHRLQMPTLTSERSNIALRWVSRTQPLNSRTITDPLHH